MQVRGNKWYAGSAINRMIAFLSGSIGNLSMIRKQVQVFNPVIGSRSHFTIARTEMTVIIYEEIVSFS